MDKANLTAVGGPLIKMKMDIDQVIVRISLQQSLVLKFNIGKTIYILDSSFENLTGDPRDNPALKAYVERKGIIEFTDNKYPALEDYNTVYADDFGQYPKLSIFTINDLGDREERTEKPYYEIVDGLISMIKWDLGVDDSPSGFILIQ